MKVTALALTAATALMAGCGGNAAQPHKAVAPTVTGGIGTALMTVAPSPDYSVIRLGNGAAIAKAEGRE